MGLMGVAGAIPPDVLRALGDRLEDNEPLKRRSAANVLGALGAAAATPQVLAALARRTTSDRNAFVRREMADAIGSIGAAAATPPVLEALLSAIAAVHDAASSEPGYRSGDYYEAGSHAAYALGRLGGAATTPVINRLAALLDHRKWQVRTAAADVLGALDATVICTEHPNVVERLDNLLHDPQGWVSVAAAEALGRLGKAVARPSITRSLNQMATKHLLLSAPAALALTQLGQVQVQPRLVRQLIKGMHQDDHYRPHHPKPSHVMVALMNQGIRVFQSWNAVGIVRWTVQHVDELRGSHS
jgi:HEAT repeat protein